jgi:hypothetical protein
MATPTASTIAVVSLQYNTPFKPNTQTNYLEWKHQVSPYLESQDLFEYVDGSIPPPVHHQKPSLACHPIWFQIKVTEKWRKQYQMILSVLLSTMTESILTQVVGQSTSQALWEALEEIFKAKSQGHIMQIRVNLTTFKKDTLSIVDYF